MIKLHALKTFSFYFNYDYGRDKASMPEGDTEAYVKHIVDTFYKNDFGKIVKVYDMVSECGRFFIITFNKETWNWDNPVATSVYATGFPMDVWECKHITNKEHPVTCKSPTGHSWKLFMTSFPDIDEKPELFGEFCYDIMWSINEYNEEYETFEIKTIPNNTIVSDDNEDDRWKHWGGDNTWWDYVDDVDDDTQIAIARENDIFELPTFDDEFKERQYYEKWAKELDETSMKYCGNTPTGNSLIGKKSLKQPEYKYDLTDISYTSMPHNIEQCVVCAKGIDGGYIPDNGYTAYTNKEFIEYYGYEDGEMRWNSDIYSAPCNMKGLSFVQDPPNGCKLKYNISYLVMNLCAIYTNEEDFNLGRSIIRKYVDALWSLTDPTDEDKEHKPVINLRADYNTNTFNLCCWHDFKYTNLQCDKRKCVERLIINFKSHLQGVEEYDDMIEWLPSAE